MTLESPSEGEHLASQSFHNPFGNRQLRALQRPYKTAVFQRHEKAWGIWYLWSWVWAAFLRSGHYYNGEVGQEALLQGASPWQQTAPPEHAQSKRLPAPPRLLNTRKKCECQGCSTSLIGKQNSLQSSKKQVLMLSLKIMWKCGINTLWKQCDKTKHYYVETLSSFN